MWRLSYQGTIATYPVALSFKLFGTSRFTLELPYLLMSAGATVCVWRIGTRFLRPFQAVFAALAFWLWPALRVDQREAAHLLRADVAPRARRHPVRRARGGAAERLGGLVRRGP